MDVAVGINRLVRRFGPVTAVDDVTLSVHPGEVFGILGHNGAGKTTLLRLINGLLRPYSGSITVFGLDPVTEGDRVRARTGVLTEYPALDHFLTCAENLRVYASIHGLPPAEASAATRRALTALDLLDRADVPSHELSAGLKQRVALARALVHDPALLLLDEPTSNLDPLAGRAVRDLVVRSARERGKTILLSTHNLAEAQSMCDRIAIMRHGRLLACGTVEELGRHTTRAAVILTVAAEDHARVGELLRPDPGVAAVPLPDGMSWEISVGHRDVPDLVARLVAEQVRILAVVPQRPTLEDIYVGFHETSPATRPVDVEAS